MNGNWEIKKLGDLCTIQLGKTPYRKNPKFWDKTKNSNNAWLSISDLKHGEIVQKSSEYITDIAAKDIAKIPKGTLLLSFKLTLGRVSFAGVDLYTNEAIAALLNLSDKITIEFLFYYFSFFDWDKAAEGDVKVKGKTLNKAKLNNLDIVIPPLPEQQRIVALLDKAFASIEQSRKNAEQNLINTKEVFDSYLQEVFENKGDDWEESEFGDIITTLTDYHANGSYKLLKKNVELNDEEDYAWMVRSTDFETNFKNPLKYIDKHAYEFMSKSKIFGNEIIMSKIGNAGKVYLMPQINRPTSLAMNLFLIRLNEHRVLPEFIFRFLKSRDGESQILKRVKGATTKTITKDNVRNIIVSFPSIKKQIQIIEKLNALSSETQKLEAIYQKKLDNLDELKKSILQKAFNGEL